MPIPHCCNLIRIDRNSILWDDVSKKGNTLQPKLVLAKLFIKSLSSQGLRDHSQVLIKTSSFLEYNKMSSMKTITKLSKNASKTLFIKFIKIVGVFVTLSGITKNLYCSYRDLKSILGMSDSLTFAWWHSNLRSNFDNILAPWSCQIGLHGNGCRFLIVTSFNSL